MTPDPTPHPARPRHVVVVGYGMAGARLADELRRRDPESRTLRITVVGAEDHPAYNRVLLSTVLAGRMTTEAVRLHGHNWPKENSVDVRIGCRVTSIDRTIRRVEWIDQAGTTHETTYDSLILATGSRPFVPSIPGLVDRDGVPSRWAIPFRTLDDCRKLLSLLPQVTNGLQPKRVAILGGGLLGMEAARGLAGRGLSVTLLHPAGHLMERQLDLGAGKVLARRVRSLGVDVMLGVRAERFVDGTAAGEPQRGLELDDGSFFPADVVVLAAGVRPEVGIAAAAGLEIGRGVVVDDQLRSLSDPDVWAIGECAEHDGEVVGLVAPAWEHAQVVADVLSGADPGASYRPSLPVTRLKAADIELATMGDPHQDEPADEYTTDVDDPGYVYPPVEVVRLVDASRGRYAKLVLRDDRVTGAIMLGFPDTAATVTQLFDRGVPAPEDRLGLLLGRIEGSASVVESPARIPAKTVICRCNTVTKGALVAAWEKGARSTAELARTTRATTGCGSCRDTVEGILEWLDSADPAHASSTVSSDRVDLSELDDEPEAVPA